MNQGHATVPTLGDGSMSETFESVLSEAEVDGRVAGWGCRACGRSAGTSNQSCQHCGSSIVGPASGLSDPRGLAIELKTGLFGRSVVHRLEHLRHIATCSDCGGRSPRGPFAKAAALRPNATAAAVRVWEAISRSSLTRRPPGGSVEVLDRELLSDLSQSRALARHGVAVGDAALVERAQLSQSERHVATRSPRLASRSKD